MTDKEKMDNLVAEIERRKKEVKDNIFELGNSESERIGLFDKEEIYNDILSFYNSMQKEPASGDLETAIDTYLATYFGGEKEKQDWPFLKKMAIHFAAWQKQQLMAKAVDGIVHRFDGCGVASVHYNDPNGVPMAYFIPSEGLSAGDKVKIITIVED